MLGVVMKKIGLVIFILVFLSIPLGAKADTISSFEVKDPIKRGDTQFLMATFKLAQTLKTDQVLAFDIKFNWLGHWAPVEIGLLNGKDQKSISLRFWHYDRPPECYLLVYTYKAGKILEIIESEESFQQVDTNKFQCQIHLSKDAVFTTIHREGKVLWRSEELDFEPEEFEKAFIEVVDTRDEKRQGWIKYDEGNKRIIFHSQGGGEPTAGYHMDGQVDNIQIFGSSSVK